jgi:DNA-binding NtrC family response regulator
MNIGIFAEQTLNTEETSGAALPETHFHILVVDDEESMRAFATDALTFGGYQADSADSCTAAINALRADHYDLVLTDFNMPNGSGADLIIKMHAEGFMMPVIMMTGAALTKELLTLTSMLHVARILQKPFRMDDLLGAVGKLLQPVQDSHDLEHHEMVGGNDSSASSESRKGRFNN